MASFVAFMDTSSDESRAGHGQVMVTVALLGSEAQWEKFSQRWNHHLSAHGLAYLHMRALSRHFRDDEEGGVRFLSRAVVLLRKYIAQSFITTLIPYEFDSVNAEYRLDRVMHSYFGCSAGTSAMFVREWFSRNLNRQGKHALDVAHESGDAGSENAFDVASRHGYEFRMLAASSAGHSESAFQAADFVAWEVRRVLEQFYQQKDPEPRKTIVEISQGLTKQIHMWNRESLLDVCVRNKVTRRTSPIRGPG